MVAMGITLKIAYWVEEFLKNITLRVKLGGHLSSEGIVRSGVPQGSALGSLLFLIFINDLENEQTCNHLFFADDVKLIASRGQQRELRSSIQKALSWSRRWDLPFNARKSHNVSIGDPPDLLSVQKCEYFNDLGITVNSAFTPSVLSAANIDSGMLYFIKM